MFALRMLRRRRAVGVGLLSLLILAAPVYAARDSLRLISADSSGAPGDGHSFEPSISLDGRMIAFTSTAPDLVAGGTNGQQHIFVYNRETGLATLVSVDGAGTQGNRASFEPSISANGRYVAFTSLASNLVAGDTNGHRDVFVHDLVTRTTSRVSVDSAGAQANGSSGQPAISGNGSLVGFASDAANLVADDTNGERDVFVHNRLTGEMSRVSIDSAGGQANGDSWRLVISQDGRYVAFDSYASDLVEADSNGVSDVFLHDRAAGTTSRVSVSDTGTEGNGHSHGPSISANGRYVAFSSTASNLVAGDSTGTADKTIDVFIRDTRNSTIQRASISSSGEAGNSGSRDSSISADGRYVAFSSGASNLVDGDTNFGNDIFVHDRVGATTVRINVSNSGEEADHMSGDPSISGAGLHVAFYSIASNLAPSDTNWWADVFLYDATGATTGQK